MACSKAKTNTSRPSFPQRLYNVLKLSEDHHKEHIISWMNDGKAFKVHDLEEFESDLLPKYFRTQKYATFTRTLCAYGFTCVRAGRQTGVYSHPKFNRNESQEDLARMKRVKNNKATTRDNDAASTIYNSQSSDELSMTLKSNLSNLYTPDQDQAVEVVSLVSQETVTEQGRLSFEGHDDFEPIPWSPTPKYSLEQAIAATLPAINLLDMNVEFEEKEDFEPIPWSPEYSPLDNTMIDVHVQYHSYELAAFRAMPLYGTAAY